MVLKPFIQGHLRCPANKTVILVFEPCFYIECEGEEKAFYRYLTRTVSETGPAVIPPTLTKSFDFCNKQKKINRTCP